MADAGRLADAPHLAAAIRGGGTSARAVLEASLVRAAALADLGAVARLEPDLGRAAAERFDALMRRGSPRATRAPLGGVPMLMKDLGAAASGLAPAAGSPAIAARTRPPAGDDDLAKRFRRLGLVPFGLSATPPFGLALTCEPQGGPAGRNPFDRTLSPGGSSGGAAAAVAAGIVAIAHATDAAGSIRVPAAACGLFGLKPTRGATPGGPSFGNHLAGLAGELVVARSARDVAAVLAVAAGDAAGPCPDPDLAGLDPDGGPLRVAVVEDGAGLAPIGAAERRVLALSADALDRLGHRVERIPAGPLAGLARRSDAVARAVLSVSLAAWLDGHDIADAEIPPLAAAVRREGRATGGPDLLAALHDGVLVAHALWRLFERHDVVLTPMLAEGPPPVGAMPLDHEDADLHWSRMAAAAPFAALANVGGVPAVSVPLADPAGGRLPRAVQLIGPMGSDRLLLALAGRLAATAPVVIPFPLAGMPGAATEGAG